MGLDAEIVAELIPTRVDHDPCAHCRMPMDMMRHGWLARLFQAKQQWSTMSSQDLKMRFDSQLSRMNCQTFSTGFSSGHRGGSGNRVDVWRHDRFGRTVPASLIEDDHGRGCQARRGTRSLRDACSWPHCCSGVMTMPAALPSRVQIAPRSMPRYRR